MKETYSKFGVELLKNKGDTKRPTMRKMETRSEGMTLRSGCL